MPNYKHKLVIEIEVEELDQQSLIDEIETIFRQCQNRTRFEDWTDSNESELPNGKFVSNAIYFEELDNRR